MNSKGEKMSSNRKQTNIKSDYEISPTVKSTVSKGSRWTGLRPRYLLVLLIAAVMLISIVPLASAQWVTPNTADGTSGVVNGGLYVKAIQPVPFGDQEIGEEHSFTVTYNLPDYSQIKWARLYEVWYSGSGTNNYGIHATTASNGNSIGNEYWYTSSTPDGQWYYVNPHTSKVYSDYFTWYNVSSYIINTTPSFDLWDGQNGQYQYVDGRLKYVALVVAYNNSSSTTNTYYWVNQGQEWLFTEDMYPYIEEDSTLFDTSVLAGHNATSAVLTEMSTSSKDAFYNFTSSSTYADMPNYQPGTPYNYFNNNVWSDSSILATLQPIASTSYLTYHHSDLRGPYGAGSYQIQVATLALTANMT